MLCVRALRLVRTLLCVKQVAAIQGLRLRGRNRRSMRLVNLRVMSRMEFVHGRARSG